MFLGSHKNFLDFLERQSEKSFCPLIILLKT